MGEARPRYRSFVQDSTRWDGFAFRPGDIVISTPPKAGTTWMQMICALLIFQTPVPPAPLSELSPWLDMLTRRREDVLALLDAQGHRRFIKTHTPLDGLPDDERVTYVCVGRDPRDVAVSMYHHRQNQDRDTVMQARAQAVGLDDVEELLALDPPANADTPEAFFWHWIANPAAPVQTSSSLRSTLHHYGQALRAADRANVVVLHYGDLQADLAGEMRRLADRLGIPVDGRVWPELVEAASFERMRARADQLVPSAALRAWKQPRQFFHSGTGGGWRAFCDAAALRRYEARVGELAPAAVAEWAHHGWRGAGPAP
jgi:hypothetical protein